MAAPLSASIQSTNDVAITARNYRSAMSLLASLFFTWGFITVINNTLLPHLRSVFDLNYTQTTLIESVWFIAYFLLPYRLPNSSNGSGTKNRSLQDSARWPLAP